MNCPNPLRPDIAEQISQLFSSLGDQQRKVLLAGLILFFVLVGSTTLLLAYMVFQPQVTAFFQAPTNTPSPTPIPTPTATPQCVQPTLTLGPNTYTVDVVNLSTPGVLPTPSGAAGTAWWVSGTYSPFIFILTPPLGSPDLQATLIPGDPMVVQWADCGREEFVYTELQVGTIDSQALLAQNSTGIAVVVRLLGNSGSYLLRGQRPELINPATPEPTSENAVTVDITFDATSFSADGKQLTTRLTITNRGSQAITITNNDLSLTPENGAPEAPLQVVPGLSQELQPGASLPLVITFTNPGGHVATLRVLDITVDLYY